MQSSHPDTAGHPQPTAPSAPAGDAARGPAAAGNAAFEVDVDKIVADALADVEAMNAVAESAAPAAPAASDDFSDLEKQIQALLNGGGAPVEATDVAAAATEAPSFDHAEGQPSDQPSDQLADPTTGASSEPSPALNSASNPAPSADLVRDALEQEPVDPLLREIDAALADDADALLRGSNGDIDSALRSVFDERALTGQEEEINRALIEAFGTSRVERPSFAVTNPLPDFEGAAREVSPDIPRDDRERREAAPTSTAAAKLGADDATSGATGSAAHGAATPDSSHATAPAATTIATAAASASTNSVASPATQLPTPTPAATSAPQPAANAAASATTTTAANTAASASSNTTPNTTSAPTAPATPRSNPLTATTATAKTAIATLLALPLRALAAPARFMPASARTIVGIAAVTLVLWTPVAWWLAQKSAKTPLVGPITIKPAAAAAAAPEAEKAAEPASGSGH